MSARRNDERDFDRLMTAWFEADAQVRAPDQLLDSVVARTRRARRRPRWLLPERWIPVELTTRLNAVPRLAPALLLVGLLLAAALAILIVGSRPKLPAPFGFAGNGMLAYLSNGQIYTADADGSNSRQFTFAKTGAATPIWSHDGTRLTYKRLPDNAPTDDPGLYGDLVVVNADGSGEKVLETSRTGLSPVLWSPDDRFFVYSYATAPDLEQVFIAPADGSSAPVRVGNPKTPNWGPNWSPDGTRISYMSGSDVWVANRDGSDGRRVNTRPFPNTTGAWWAPDGKHILFSAGVWEHHDLWLVGFDGLPERRLTDHEGNEDSPAYSPDGTKIAYLQGFSASGPTRVVIMNADGTGSRTLDDHYGWLGPIWAPDGTGIVVGDYVNRPPKFFLLDPTGNAPRVEIKLPAVAPPTQLSNLVEIPAWQRVAQ